MNKFFILLVFFLPILMGCKQETIVLLKFKNAEGQEVKVLRPVNHNLLGITDTIPAVRNDSVYRFTLVVNQMAPMIIIADRKRLEFVVSPNEKISITCDFKAWDSCRFECDNISGELLYNKLSKTKKIYKYESVKFPLKFPLDTLPEKVEQYFRGLQENEIRQFDSLYRRKEISYDFLTYVSKDIRLYYSTTLSKICRGLADKVKEDRFGKYWTKIYEEQPLQEEDLNCRWFSDYAGLYLESYLPYQKTRHPSLDAEKEGDFHLPYKQGFPGISTEEEYYDYFYSFYNHNITNPRILEVVLGTELFLKGLNNKTFSPAILKCFDKFNQQFPGNPYAARFIPFIQQIKDFQLKMQGELSPDIHFVEGYPQISNWEELMERFKGKPVFIDFWFSTCGPCREEFAYAKPLKDFLETHQVEMLYISVDPEEREKNWRNSIRYFNLNGWHLRTSPAFRDDFYKKFAICSFPTYMLVGKEGEVLLRNAKCPSEKEDLYQQITEALKGRK